MIILICISYNNLKKRRNESHTNGNLYAYAANNPVKYTDPTGMCAYADSLENPEENAYAQRQYYLEQFKNTTFTADNPLNQLDFDKALGLQTNSKTTKSCQSTAMINAYAKTDGITGEQILDAVLNKDGSFKNLNSDGSPILLRTLSKSLAKAMGRENYKDPSDYKIKGTILANLKYGAILGYTKNGKTDDHFGYIDFEKTIDSLDPNRPSAKDYTMRSYRILTEKKL